LKKLLKSSIIFLLCSYTYLSASIVGTTKGEFSVNQGTASYNVEIVTPKGVAGLKPSLSINYNSSNNFNGLVGVGFSISGISQISKCNQTLFNEKKDSSRNYNYCLDGQKLVTKDSNTTYGNNTEYKTKIDSYSKIVKDSTGWTIYKKDGLIYYYGYTADSKDSSVFYRVNKIKDRYNNEINYKYDTTLKSLLQITYANNVIDLIYENRNDTKELYSRGIKITQSKRLKKVSIKTNTVEQSSYNLAYDFIDNKSILKSITETIGGKSLLPVVFDRKAFSNLKFNTPSYVLPNQFAYNQGWRTDKHPRSFVDINGDGLVDIIGFFNSGVYASINLLDSMSNKLTKITNNKDQNIGINYTTLRDSTIYTSNNDLTYPNQEIKSSSMKIVKDFTIDNGIGGKNKTSFKYKNLSANYERGSLGFEEIETLDETSNAKSIITYNQNYLKNSTQENYDYDTNRLLSQKSTINANIDIYGNNGLITTTTQGNSKTFRKTITNSYSNYESNWILGRLTKSRVKHEASGQNSITRESKFEYDSSKGTLTKEIIEPNSTKHLSKTYTYDSYGNKKSETISGSNIESRTTTYTYDSGGKNIKKIVNPLGHTQTNRYYSHSNQLKSTRGANNLTSSFVYDDMGRKIKETRADGNHITWEYTWTDTGHKVTQKLNGQFPVVVYYDTLGRKIKTQKIAFDGRKIFEDIEYDEKGNKVRVSTPYFEYDTPLYINYSYDDINRLIEIDSPAAHDNRASDTIRYYNYSTTKTNAKNQTKTTTVNAIGKVVNIDDGSTINYTYDATGNLSKTVDAKNNTILIKYDT
jgi:YD repeat-containing protein